MKGARTAFSCWAVLFLQGVGWAAFASAEARVRRTSVGRADRLSCARNFQATRQSLGVLETTISIVRPSGATALTLGCFQCRMSTTTKPCSISAGRSGRAHFIASPPRRSRPPGRGFPLRGPSGPIGGAEGRYSRAVRSSANLGNGLDHFIEDRGLLRLTVDRRLDHRWPLRAHRGHRDMTERHVAAAFPGIAIVRIRRS